MEFKYGFVVIKILLLLILNEPVMSSWDFAVTTNGQILFFDSTWTQVTSAAHQFNELSAIALDETQDTIYFNDQAHNSGTIFALELSADGNHRVETVLQKTKNETIHGIAFDPLDRVLYWTDSDNKSIYKWPINKQEEPTVFMRLNESKRPHGIAIDVCRRKLYWTNVNHPASIERASLDGSKYEVIVQDLDRPLGITVDQFSKRIYWVDDLEALHYALESAELDGTQRRYIKRDLYHAPLDLTLSQNDVYFTDITQKAVYSIGKNPTSDIQEPSKVKDFSTWPKGIVSRTHFLSSQADNAECKAVVEQIRANLMKTSTSEAPVASQLTVMAPPTDSQQICLNDGTVNPKNNKCICLKQFKGEHCELPLCHNYCFGNNGICHVSSTGYAQCTCHPGFSGDRCERDACTGFCLNNAQCVLENNEPVCKCLSSYSGRHCETMDTNVECDRFCNEKQIDGINEDLASVCGNCIDRNATNQDNVPLLNNSGKTIDQLLNGSCSNSFNRTAVFVSIGVVVALVLVFIIVSSVRRIYKPLRPRIRKTYVVHKNVTPTPLTCRPTTEQCEITIENCCNMNICDTPCFDPKILQQEVARKEDKKTLLNNMDADLMY